MVRTDLGIDETGSSRSYDEGGMENDGEGHDIVSMESLIQGHFDEDPDRAMTRAEWDAITVDSAKKASAARELLRLKKKVEGELRAKVKALAIPAAATPKPIQSLAQAAADSPIDTAFGALGGEMDEAMPDVP